jgi:hypothetical protein
MFEGRFLRTMHRLLVVTDAHWDLEGHRMDNPRDDLHDQDFQNLPVKHSNYRLDLPNDTIHQ